MSPEAVERRLEMVDELRELALDLSRAQRLGPVKGKQDVVEMPSSLEIHSHINNYCNSLLNRDLQSDGS